MSANKQSMTRSVYVDGSCFNNGKKNSAGGIGVYFGDGDSRNVSCRIVDGKVTNQTMELRACLAAIEAIIASRKEDEFFTIYTDSMYVVKCMTSWADAWKRNGWKTKDDAPVSNMQLIKKTHELYKASSPWIRLEFVRAHGKRPENMQSVEYKLWHGNDRAHRLATAGANAPASAACRIDRYFNLRVTF